MASKEYLIPGTNAENDYDGIRSVKVGGRNICIVTDKGKIFAIQNKCPHAGADLSQGWCEAGKIVCPYHRHSFDLESGKGSPGQGNYINTYPITQKDGSLFVRLPAWWEFWK